MSASASEAISYAQDFKGKRYSDMTSSGMRAGNPNAWCADFVAFVLSKKGVKSGLGSSSQQFIGMSGWHSASDYTPKKGDVFVLTNTSGSGGHTGFVASVSGSGSSYKCTTIEGNYSSKVASATLTKSGRKGQVLKGYWTPPYSSDSSSSKGKSSDKKYKEYEIRTLEGEITIRPHAVSIKAEIADTIKISGIGKYLSGLYYVSEVHRTISSDGFSQTMNLLKTNFTDSLKEQSTDVVHQRVVKRG